MQVATPGRLNDHLENGNLLPKMMGNLRMLILDEADRLLDMGFRWVNSFPLHVYLPLGCEGDVGIVRSCAVNILA